jgi:dimethylamine/trimethylamine dehydrogenase
MNSFNAQTNSRYKCLFEPVKIGPVTSKNRFYQVPHCCGMGHAYPKSVSAIRAMKAEGGWGVVCTEETEIHPSSDLAPALEGRLWEERDIPAFAEKTAAIHQHGALAGIELSHNGLHAPNMYSREIPLAPSNTLVDWGAPINARAMDKTDIANMRRWYVNAAKRAQKAGFDIVYVYAGHDMSLLQHFISKRHNQRSDEYGGSLQNRLRLFREVLADTKEAIGDHCAIAVRLAVDELLGKDGISAEGEGYEIIASLAEEPDLWDVNVSGWANDSQTSRFSEEGYQERYISFVKSLTSKPVVGVGRYTSPDTMARLISKGVMDLIGAARPSIADPFLPQKIEQGREDDIRECIGCNICVASDMTSTPIRCTQNPTMGEEWRKGWHPEFIAPASSIEQILIIGGGPAGLEASRALAARGHNVTLADSGMDWGGRVLNESALPGLSAWRRVRDWRVTQLEKMSNVEMYLQSEMRAADINELGATQIILATGARWHKGRYKDITVFTPDNIMADELPVQAAHVVIYDTEGFYIGALLAEKCARTGIKTSYLTTAAVVSSWTVNTLEQNRIHKRLLECGVELIFQKKLIDTTSTRLEIACVFTGKTRFMDCDALIPVALRQPVDDLWYALMDDNNKDPGGVPITRIGDCLAPTTIAGAVYSGHRFARELGETVDPDKPSFRREG